MNADDGEDTRSPSRPGSSRPGSARPSPRPSPTAGSRPGSSKPGSRGSSRPSSAKPQSKPSSATHSGHTSPIPEIPSEAGSRKGSTAGERPASGAGSVRSGTPDKPFSAVSDRPPSAGKTSRKGSAASDRPSSAIRPSSGISGKRSPMDRPSSGRPGSSKSRSVVAPEEPEDELEGLEDGAEDNDINGAEDYNFDEAEEFNFDSTAEHAANTGVGETDMMGQPPMDPDGGGDSDGGSGDDEDDEEEDDMDVIESDEEGSDDETNMVVLDPDHPLMTRFQSALKAHLQKQLEKVTLELKELEESNKGKKKEREDLGVDLYGVQQELARFQMMLEKHQDEFSTIEANREQEEKQLSDVRDYYKETQVAVNKERKKGAELQSEVENLALRLFYMSNAKEDVRSDIAIMRRAAEKAESEVSKAEIEKQQQDLYVDRLVEAVDKLKGEMAMYEAQITAQTEETRSAKEALMEAHMEIDAINLEKKQLYQQWNSSLIGMRRRDEAHAAMMDALNQQQQKILSLETEIDGYKKSVQKEQEQNEKLTLILNKTERDIENVKKQLTQCQAKHDALKAEYATYTRMLHETEQALNRALTDKTLRQNELNALRKQIEREYLEKVQLEDEIMEKMRSQLTLDKASQYTKKLTNKLRDLTKSLETQMAEVENQISKNSLEISNVCGRIERLKKVMEQLDEEIKIKNDIISKSENEIVKRNAIVERKQNILDQYNKRLEHLITTAGGVELGPLEITINSLQKSIDSEMQEITELQQLWLRQQTELVRLSKEKEDQSVDVEKLKKQLTILSQKKIRTENEIDSQNRESYDIERSIRNMQNDIIKLNTLLHKEKGKHTGLQNSNTLMENDFITNLKEAERESIELQAKLDDVKEEKERLLNSLVEAERQIMLWEKKTQLARETRAAVDSEVGQGEVRAMKAEIHRMQVRYAQLMKQQEKMIQEMEKAVSRRDTIVTRGDASAKLSKKVLTKGTFERHMAELRKKIKQTIQDANSADSEIAEFRLHQQNLSEQLDQQQTSCQQLQGDCNTLDGDVERLIELKQKNLSELLTKQQKMKYYQQLKDGKYTKLCKSEAALENEHQKQVDRMQALNAIVDRLNQEFPHAQPALRRVTLSLSSRNEADES